MYWNRFSCEWSVDPYRLSKKVFTSSFKPVTIQPRCCVTFHPQLPSVGALLTGALRCWWMMGICSLQLVVYTKERIHTIFYMRRRSIRLRSKAPRVRMNCVKRVGCFWNTFRVMLSCISWTIARYMGGLRSWGRPEVDHVIWTTRDGPKFPGARQEGVTTNPPHQWTGCRGKISREEGRWIG